MNKIRNLYCFDCFIFKWAVKNGMLEAYKEIEKKKAQEALKADKTIIDLEQKK